MYYIFRKSDGVLLHQSTRLKQIEAEKEACLRNEGGTVDDYIYTESDRAAGLGQMVVFKSGEVTIIDNPKHVARVKVRESLSVKLQALGLTEEEIRMMGR